MSKISTLSLHFSTQKEEKSDDKLTQIKSTTVARARVGIAAQCVCFLVEARRVEWIAELISKVLPPSELPPDTSSYEWAEYKERIANFSKQ